jgi:hypothetical protein
MITLHIKLKFEKLQKLWELCLIFYACYNFLTGDSSPSTEKSINPLQHSCIPRIKSSGIDTPSSYTSDRTAFRKSDGIFLTILLKISS